MAEILRQRDADHNQTVYTFAFERKHTLGRVSQWMHDLFDYHCLYADHPEVLVTDENGAVLHCLQYPFFTEDLLLALRDENAAYLAFDGYCRLVPLVLHFDLKTYTADVQIHKGHDMKTVHAIGKDLAFSTDVLSGAPTSSPSLFECVFYGLVVVCELAFLFHHFIV